MQWAAMYVGRKARRFWAWNGMFVAAMAMWCSACRPTAQQHDVSPHAPSTKSLDAQAGATLQNRQQYNGQPLGERQPVAGDQQAQDAKRSPAPSPIGNLLSEPSGAVGAADARTQRDSPQPGDVGNRSTRLPDSPPVAVSSTGQTRQSATVAGAAQGSDQPRGRQLYLQHCAACHGERGDGQGIAAPQLYPRPRNFRTGRFRLVSTSNNVPTRDDLRTVLERGMPGSAMIPWPHLSQNDRELLIDEVLRLRREGAIELYTAALKEQEGLSDDELSQPDIQAEIRQAGQLAIEPGDATEVPPFDEPTAEAIARGRQVYVQFGCVPCHGEQGRGDGIQKMLDDDQLPTRPRDFTAGIFKGRDDPASLYRRIAYGMPGTPMPGSSQMTPQQMTDLVHYVLSLSTSEQRESTVLNRQTISAEPVPVVPEDIRRLAWDELPVYTVRLTPLWWRDDSIRQIELQAVHDGRSLALRVSWHDETADDHTLFHEAFSDALAVEWYVGENEPFVGMGSADAPVEVWLWDARRHAGHTVEDQYPRTVADVYPFSETVVETAEGQRLAAHSRRQPPISQPAQAVGNRIVPDDPVGDRGGLVAGGPGTVTFRVAASSWVHSVSERNGNRWTVWFRRSLRPESAEQGLPLMAQQPTVVAFAVWDGSHADRNGQKMVSIWQPWVLK